MSKQAFDQVIQRASSDARFKASLSENFEAAVRPYDLSEDEKVRLAKGLGLSAVARAHQMPSTVAANMDASTVHAQTTEAETTQAQTTQAQTTEAETTQAQTTEAETTQAQTTQAQTTESQINQAI